MNGVSVSLKAVSYTHLDVYKRQIRNAFILDPYRQKTRFLIIVKYNIGFSKQSYEKLLSFKYPQFIFGLNLFTPDTQF